ncbi:MAG: alpha/beta hydrolase [bacterium]|nr:alpha/beta hydrolase [bacterium]
MYGKITCILIIGLVAGFVLNGCSSEKPGEKPTIEKTPTPPKAVQTMPGPVQLRKIILNQARKQRGTPEEVKGIEKITIPGPGGEIPLRIYTPEGSGPFPVLVHIHGGGWVFGDLETHDNICRVLANRVTGVVVSVDYRLSPEHKFPAALEDSFAAYQWTVANIDRLNGKKEHIAVLGDSSGGNLAAVVCMMAKEKKVPAPAFQVLLNPVLNLASMDTQSYLDNAVGAGLSLKSMEYFREHYLSNPEERQNPYVSPLLAVDLSGLPPALVVTGEFDVLRDEGEAYAKRLQEAGVAAGYFRFPGIRHMGLSWATASKTIKPALDETVKALNSAFGR